MQQPVSERISILLDKYAKGNKAEMGRVVGVSGQAIADLIEGKKGGPSFPVLQKMLRAYPDLRAEWLIFGEGEMLKSLEAGEGEGNIRLVSAGMAVDYASYGFAEPAFIGNLPTFSVPEKVFARGTFRCFVVPDDSMHPTLNAGDWVICRFIERRSMTIHDHCVYVVVTKEGIRAARLVNRPSAQGNLALHSDNPAYPVDFLGSADVLEVWEVMRRLSSRFANPRHDVLTEIARHSAEIAELFQAVRELKAKN